MKWAVEISSGAVESSTFRLPALDGLRGCLAAVVVADHAITELGSQALGIPADIAVAVFFLLSGLVLTRAWDGHFARFLARRFVRLWPVFALCLGAAGLLAKQAPAYLEFFWIPWPRYDANVLCPPMWSLFLEAWAAAVMPLIVWTSRGGILRTLGSAVGCVALAVAWHPQHAALRAFTSYLVCFVVGAGLSRTNPRSNLLEAAVPQWLGRVSYSLYLTHWLVLRAATAYFGMPGTLVGAVACFPVAWLVWRWVENPSIRLSRRVGRAVA